MWNYLIITASNEAQAAGYRWQLDLRRQLGLLGDVQNVLVVADPGGRRVGSGGSTLFCLMEVLQRELGDSIADIIGSNGITDSRRLQQVLAALRILIIHAGGDSKRLPAYGPCGKIFVPVPGESDRCLPLTLFDRQLPVYMALPAVPAGAGQIVITSGDVMLRFDPQQVSFNRSGLTGLGCYADPAQAANHGVYCGVDTTGRVCKFLQKPTPSQQQALGATNHYGQSVLDIGVMNFDAGTAVRLLEIFGLRTGEQGRAELGGEMGRAVMDCGLDFYREICCGMGSEVTSAHHIAQAHSSGSIWDDVLLGRLLQGLGDIDFNLELLRHCEFIDFGTTAHIVRSGMALMQQDKGTSGLHLSLDINNDIQTGGQLTGANAWVEGCRIRALLNLAGDNVVTGADIDRPLELPAGACLDITAGNALAANKADEKGTAANDGYGDTDRLWFVRCYNIADTFKDNITDGATFCGMPLGQWLQAIGADEDEVWADDVPADKRTLWNARVFPVVADASSYDQWLWMYNPATASAKQKARWLSTRRYSSQQIATLTSPREFFRRRLTIRAAQIRSSLRKMFRPDSGLSAAELAYMLSYGDNADNSDDKAGWIAALIAEACWHYDAGSGTERLIFPRIIHTLGTLIENLSSDKASGNSGRTLGRALPGLADLLAPSETDWLNNIGLELDLDIADWTQRAHKLAFDALSRAIVFSGGNKPSPPVNTLRSDEIVWGRAPARFDTGGGWTDTPPYSLEYGGCVVNTAVDLNGQPPIQAYARLTDELVITIGSIDLGTRIKISQLDELLDYNEATSKYGLVKAALALSGFSPDTASWPADITLADMLKSFGGGLEITTLAAIPKGSGLGTSSIMGAVLLAVINRAMGRELTPRELFNRVLQLEQALTTGGGWQDQVGGAVGGVKIVYATPGLIPDTHINYLPDDVINPAVNGGVTLLYYTGITRLARNILEQVVGRYLNRNRKSMATLQKIKDLTAPVADAMSRKDLPTFGQLVAHVWQLNKQLDPNSTNDEVEKLFARVEPYIYGAKLLGAGGGGFMLMVAKSPADAATITEMLNANPPNDRARFFDYSINTQGLVVTVC